MTLTDDQHEGERTCAATSYEETFQLGLKGVSLWLVFSLYWCLC